MRISQGIAEPAVYPNQRYEKRRYGKASPGIFPPSVYRASLFLLFSGHFTSFAAGGLAGCSEKISLSFTVQELFSSDRSAEKTRPEQIGRVPGFWGGKRSEVGLGGRIKSRVPRGVQKRSVPRLSPRNARLSCSVERIILQGQRLRNPAKPLRRGADGSWRCICR